MCLLVIFILSSYKSLTYCTLYTCTRVFKYSVLYEHTCKFPSFSRQEKIYTVINSNEKNKFYSVLNNRITRNCKILP